MKITLKDFDRFQFLRRPSMMYPFAMFGIETGEGWYSLLYSLCEDIEDYLTSMDENFIEGFYVTQIKEKFGGLRFYTSFTDKHISKLIEEYEDKSYRVCELCGRPGALRNTGWMTTLCRRCFWPSIIDSHLSLSYRLKLIMNWIFK